MDQINLIESS